MELQNWKGLISKAMFLRAWATRSDSWGMHAAHSLSVLHKSRKQLLLPLVLGHWGALFSLWHWLRLISHTTPT